VQFIEGDYYDPARGGPFDAIVERLALYQIPDPAEVLRRQATVLRPGGLVVPIEIDATTYYSEPEITLLTQFVS
jgi:SAM-dependent methyltransferase